MRHFYQVTRYDIERMEKHPANKDLDEGRFFIDTYSIALRQILHSIFDNKVKYEPNLNELSFDFQLDGSQLLELEKWGITLTEFSPKQRKISELKDRLSDDVADNIKNGYYDVADKIYDLIRSL